MARRFRPGRIVWLTVFGIAFGFLEGAVVVYLRGLYYPDGFAFPAAVPSVRHLALEVGREAATLLMLLGTAMVGGRSRWDRFGVFCFLFGIWDLVYYLTLWAVLGWPEGPFTWDILFLIPLVWAGPVVSAVLVAMSLVAAGFLIMRWVGSGRRPRTPAWIWAGAALAFLLLLGSFLANHGTVRAGGVPQSFPWGLYAPGLVLGWLCFGFAFGPRPKNPPTD